MKWRKKIPYTHFFFSLSRYELGKKPQFLLWLKRFSTLEQSSLANSNIPIVYNKNDCISFCQSARVLRRTQFRCVWVFVFVCFSFRLFFALLCFYIEIRTHLTQPYAMIFLYILIHTRTHTQKYHYLNTYTSSRFIWHKHNWMVSAVRFTM